MKYFEVGLTLEQIKSEYRRWCKLIHLDLGPAAEKEARTAHMQDLNSEYAVASMVARRMEEPTRRREQKRAEPTERDYANMADVDEKIRQAIETVIKFSFLRIEICGQWVWIAGTSKRGSSAENDAALDAMMSAGYRWSSPKKMWYFAGVPAGYHKEKWDIERIRRAYGSCEVRHDEERKEQVVGALA